MRRILAGPFAALLASSVASAIPRYNDPAPVRQSPLAARLEDALRGARPPLTVDGRLEAALRRVLAAVPEGSQPPADVVTEALHLEGIVEPSPLLVALSMGDLGEAFAVEEVAKRLPELRTGGRYRRAAVAIAPSTPGRVRVLLGLQESFVELAPVARELPPGGGAVIDARLLPPYRSPQLVITRPDGTVARSPLAPADGGRTRGGFRCAERGRFQVEITGEDRFGPAVLANFPIYCGVSAPTGIEPVAPVAAEPRWRDAAEAEARGLALLNADRTRGGLPPLTLDPTLSRVARGHSEDMRDHGFFGHVSPTTGSADDRLRAASIRPLTVLENVGHAYSPSEVERGLMDSPGHRANIMSRDVDRVGVGCAVATVGGTRELFVTQLFARLPERFEPTRALAELRAQVASLRAARRLHPLATDEALDGVAGEVARGLADRTLSPESPGLPVERAMKRLSGRFRALRTVVAHAGEVRQLDGSQALLDGSVTHAGVAVAAAPPDERGRTLWLVILLGTAR